jgi:NADP-dependent 3-hydroxy acid dehydrogenase YdfG
MNGSVVLVTGASAGIGAACVDVFLEAGATVIAWARRPIPMREQYADRLITQQVDVRDRAAVNEAYRQLSDLRVDVLVNNAGLSRGLCPLHEGLETDWEEMIDTNLKGLLWVTKAVLPGMVERNAGTIVNIASIAGKQPYRGGNVYSATKAAVKMLSDSMQIDLHGTGVRVCNLDPGLVETEFSLVRFHGDEERAAKVYSGYTPLAPRDVADVVHFVVTRPPHVSIHDLLLMPTDQATISLVNRKT